MRPTPRRFRCIRSRPRSPDVEDRIWNIRRIEDGAHMVENPGKSPAHRRDRGERPHDAGARQRNAAQLASPLAGRVAQPDSAGPGRGGIRCIPRRCGDGSGSWPLKRIARSLLPRCRRRCCPRWRASPLLVKYLSLLIGLMVVLAFGVRPALRKSLSAGRKARLVNSRAVDCGASQLRLPPARGCIA